jgi:predicted transcriptional regulator
MSTTDLSQLDLLIRYAEHLDVDPTKSFTEEEISRIWSLDIYKTKSILRKLRKAGLVRRTRAGRYKLTLAGSILVHLYKRVKMKK